jgi:hypothetical protein
VGPRAGMDDLEKSLFPLPGFGAIVQPLASSLYRLRYQGSYQNEGILLLLLLLLLLIATQSFTSCVLQLWTFRPAASSGRSNLAVVSW